MCLDYRQVNTNLVTNLLHLEELVENVADSEYYATLDLKDAYFQVILDEGSKDSTASTGGVDLYRFKRLPFSLSCSASLFVRHLQGTLAPLIRELHMGRIPANGWPGLLSC